MINKNSNGVYEFKIKGKGYELFVSEDSGFTEIYETEDPSHTGFIFPDLKQFFLFINNITDVAEKEKEKKLLAKEEES